MDIRMPFAPTSAAMQSLKRCIKFSAANTSQSPQQVAVTMSYFFQQLAEEIAAGENVTVPGFGQFGPRITKHACTGEVIMRVAFFASRGLGNLVRDKCPVIETHIIAHDDYRRGNAITGGNPPRKGRRHHRSTSRPFKTLDKFRQVMRAQATRKGLVVTG